MADPLALNILFYSISVLLGLYLYTLEVTYTLTPKEVSYIQFSFLWHPSNPIQHTHTHTCTRTQTDSNTNVNDTTDIKILLADVTQEEQMLNMLTTYTRSCR